MAPPADMTAYQTPAMPPPVPYTPPTKTVKEYEAIEAAGAKTSAEPSNMVSRTYAIDLLKQMIMSASIENRTQLEAVQSIVNELILVPVNEDAWKLAVGATRIHGGIL
jgi:hypothetical protein